MKMTKNGKSGWMGSLGSALILCVISGPALAEADLYFMHNGSPYFIWTDRDVCVNDMANNSNKCVTISVCGSGYASTQATLNVAVDKYNRNETIVVRGRYNNGTVCTIQK